MAVIERLLGEGESFTELSVERLVSEAGMSRSTFYVYFEDKGDLMRAWFSEVTEELVDAASAWWGLEPDATRHDLQAALTKLVTCYRPHAALLAATADAAAYDTSVRELMAALMDQNVAALRKHIREGQKRGSIDPGLLPVQTAAWLTWMAERGCHQLVRGAGDAEVGRLVEAYTGIVWNTLYAPTQR